MSFDRLSVTIPTELGAALRSLASSRGESVSAVITEAVAHQVRLAALDVALANADRRFGPVAEAAIDRAEATLRSRPSRRRSGSKRKHEA